MPTGRDDAAAGAGAAAAPRCAADAGAAATGDTTPTRTAARAATGADALAARRAPGTVRGIPGSSGPALERLSRRQPAGSAGRLSRATRPGNSARQLDQRDSTRRLGRPLSGCRRPAVPLVELVTDLDVALVRAGPAHRELAERGDLVERDRSVAEQLQ